MKRRNPLKIDAVILSCSYFVSVSYEKNLLGIQKLFCYSSIISNECLNKVILYAYIQAFALGAGFRSPRYLSVNPK